MSYSQNWVFWFPPPSSQLKHPKSCLSSCTREAAPMACPPSVPLTYPQPLGTCTTLSQSRRSRHSAIKDSAPKRPRPAHTGANHSPWDKGDPSSPPEHCSPRYGSRQDAMRYCPHLPPSSQPTELHDELSPSSQKTFREHEILLPSQISIHLHIFLVFFFFSFFLQAVVILLGTEKRANAKWWWSEVWVSWIKQDGLDNKDKSKMTCCAAGQMIGDLLFGFLLLLSMGK